MNEQSEHLSSAQIENYGDRTSGAGLDANHKAAWVEAHLDGCPDCRGRLLDFQRTQLGLVTGSNQPTDRTVNTASTPDCPSQDALRQLAAGLLANNVAHKLTNHAATCDHCGPLLRVYTEDFSEDFSPQEQAVLAKLQSSSAEWQRKTAQEMILAAAAVNAPVISANQAASFAKENATTAKENPSPGDNIGGPRKNPSPASEDAGITSQDAGVTSVTAGTATSLPKKSSSDPGWKPGFWKWTLIPAATAACAAIAFGIWYTQRDTPEKVEKLLAQAFTEQRPMELMWPGAEWGPVRVTRGAEDSRFTKPPALLKAEGKIGEHSSFDQKNIGWLQARAEADILERNPEAAIVGLNQALETNPESISIMLDMSIAYYLQGEISLDPQNYEKSVDLLGQVLAKDPGNVTALFNRALLNEQMKMVDSAIADWELFLQKEKDPGWHDDARKRLAALQELKRKKSSYIPPNTIEQWTTALNSESPTAAEEAIEVATIEWLPKAYPDHGPQDRTNSAYVRLLALAAVKLQKEHHDNWLADLLRFAPAPNFSRGVSELKTAILLNSQGKASDAIAPARSAEALFKRAHNLAGLARAQLEEVYAYQRSAKGSPCVARSSNLRSTIGTHQYQWLTTQLLLDEASCFNILGRLDEAKLDADDALSQNGGSISYRILQLRVLGIAAGLATTRGDRSFAVKQDLAGLQEYWVGQYPIVRAYQFYSDLSFNTEAAELWHLTYAADQEAVWAISQTANKQVEAVARYRFAKAAVMLGKQSTVNDQRMQADRLFAELPKTESTLIAQIDGIIGVIKSHINLGAYETALNQFKLISIPPEFTQSRLIARRMYQVRGDIELKRGNLKEAQNSYLAAIKIAESGLRSLQDDRARFIWNRENSLSYRALADILVKQGDIANAFETLERYRSASIRQERLKTVAYQGLKTHLAVANVNDSDIVHRAQQGFHTETLISYVFFPEGLAIWIVDDSGVHFTFAKIPSLEIRRLARIFTEECSNPTSDISTLRKTGNMLYQALLQPVSAHLKPGRLLVFETDGELDVLPFSALVDTSDKYLAETYSIIFSPGFAYRHYLRKPQPILRTNNILVVGDPAISERWRRILPQLFSAKTEAVAVAMKFKHPILLLGPEASNSQLLRYLPTMQLFQFAGHAIETNSGTMLLVANSRQPPEDSNTFAVDQVLMSHMNLIVLSACSTGRQWNVNSGLFAALFFHSHIPQVIASRWQIDSHAASAFMNSFYDSLLVGRLPVDSLRYAEHFQRQQQVTSHPYYWSAFMVIGRD